MTGTALKGRAILIRADARHLPLSDGSVDLVVTSPPFLNLRSYQDAGQHYAEQIGTGTQTQFLADLWEVMAECKRVLKPSGSIFVELGDSYTNKSLNNSPHRFAIGCTDRLGLIQRAEIIWDRPNGLPESVTDRVRRSHSVWFHFTKQPRYFSAVDEIRETYSDNTHARRKDGGSTGWTDSLTRAGSRRDASSGLGGKPNFENPLGKLPGSVWTIPTQPLQVPAELGIDHFAAFPMEWPRRIIQGWSPAGVCTACGEGRRPVASSLRVANLDKGIARRVANAGAQTGGIRSSTLSDERGTPSAAITGYACACVGPQIDVEISEFDEDGEWVTRIEQRTDPAWRNPAATTPSVVVDPFGGTGTTALVAKALGRTGISVDLSQDYCRLAEWRTTDPGQMAAALQVEKPAEIHADQLDLFDGEFGSAQSKARGNSGSSLVGIPRQTCSACGYRSQNARAAACEKCGQERAS